MLLYIFVYRDIPVPQDPSESLLSNLWPFQSTSTDNTVRKDTTDLVDSSQIFGEYVMNRPFVHLFIIQETMDSDELEVVS